MRNYKIFILSILIFGAFNACKHEFEEGTYWSWYTKAELLTNKNDYKYLVTKYFINNDEYKGAGFVINYTLNYTYNPYTQSRGLVFTPRYVPIKDSLVFLRAENYSGRYTAFDSLDHAISWRNKWKITYLKDNILRVRTNYKGQVHKMELKINY